MSVFKSPEFWENFCSGEPNALGKYAGEVAPIVFKAAHKARCEDHDAEVLECTLRRTRDRFCPVSIDLNRNPIGFIWTIARSCASNIRKKDRSESFDPHANELRGLEKDAPDFPSDARESQREFDLRANSLIECFGYLSPEQQEAVAFVIDFTHSHGMSIFKTRLPWTEMAGEIGWPVETLKHRFKRGRDELRCCMSKEHSDERSP